MTVLRLSKQAHDTYLAGLPDIDERLSRHALRQWADLDRQRRLHPTTANTDGCGCGPTCACIGHDHTAEDTPTDPAEPAATHTPTTADRAVPA
jgi:hypothetical protein